MVERILKFVSTTHDIGKATPAFQGKMIFQNPDVQIECRRRLDASGIPMRYDLDNPNLIPHSFASQYILESRGIDRSVASIVGGHHGTFPNRDEFRKISSFKNHTGVGNKKWDDIHDELLGYSLYVSELDYESISSLKIAVHSQILLTALVIMSDWISSNEYDFPYDEEFTYSNSILKERAIKGWDRLSIPSIWTPDTDGIVDILYQSRFGFNPRPFQKSILDILNNINSPGLIILEAPMGEGKTEAALAAAEILADRFGKSGLFFALPTQATSDGIFDRVKNWMEKAVGKYSDERHSLFLAHGKSRFNESYTSLYQKKWNVGSTNENHNGNVIVHDWFNGRKKGILSDVVVGTVDQILMASLKQKHLVLRHLGLANKVVIIDECHAYDTYMGSYLVKTLRWLGAYKVPVILLSATLPPNIRYDFVKGYMFCGTNNEPASLDWVHNKNYPLLTYADSEGIFQNAPESSGRTVKINIENISDEDILGILEDHTSEGGFVGIILNTVNRAQELSKKLSDRFGEEQIQLIHSRFTNIDRSVKEAKLLEILDKGNRLSPGNRLFVIGTQVIEQSLDLDFDLLITDLCPMDLLIQRMGRLHRHIRKRSAKMHLPLCYVLDNGKGDFEPGAESVYGKYHLMNSRELLRLRKTINFPDEIPFLVHAAYDVNGIPMPEALRDEYDCAHKELEQKMIDKERRAKVFQIKHPEKTKNLMGWTEGSGSDTERAAQATVRDVNSSLEVIVVRKDDEGNFRMISSVSEDDGSVIPSDSVPDGKLAFRLAGCKVSLPGFLSADWKIDETIRYLEMRNSKEIPKCWQESEWLNGELFLLLDNSGTTTVITYSLRYDTKFGLMMVYE